MTYLRLTPTKLRCEYKTNPVGIDVRQPRLSWQLESPRRGVMQTAYQIRVASSIEVLQSGRELVWDSGQVLTDHSVHRPYGGRPLQSGQRCYWHVRVWTGDGRPWGWSEPAFWEMGLLSPSDWLASWIEPDWEEEPETRHPCPYLRTSFQVMGEVKQARAYATSHGLYELSLNGTKAGDQLFTPGFTAYQARLQYQTYDVTDLIREGENAIGAILGDGWYRGKVGVNSRRNLYGTRLALLLQLHILFQDGSEQVVLSGDRWRATTGPILESDLKDGEIYDARLEMPGWNEPGFDDSAWQEVRCADHRTDHLVAPYGPPVRRKEEFSPAAILHTPAGQTVVDMGQNLAGRVRLTVQGPAGATVSLRHGESLDENGNFSMDHLNLPLPGADKLLQRVRYTLKGERIETYEPHFTFHGFRYVLVEEFPGDLAPENLTAVAIYSDMPLIGTFECSNPLINQLQHNIEWSQKSNFLDIPTDCPQRERAGWTGDAQIFARTGSFVMDTAAFFAKWLRDLAAEQREDGAVTSLVPNTFQGVAGIMGRASDGSAGWGDAAVIIPWTLYQCYGDERILEEQYPSMQAWVDYIAGRAENHHWTKRLSPAYWLNRAKRERQPYIWDTGYHWGEWLEPGTSGLGTLLTIAGNLIFSRPLVATAYFAYSTRLLANAARVLGRDKDAERYALLAERIKSAYAGEFVGRDGRIKPNKQASYVRAIALDLMPEALVAAAARHLVELIRDNDTHLGTGFLSTPFLCHVLSNNGYLDVAYDLLNQDTIPSWLYPITKGATTIWESWDGIKPDGSVYGSLNHYSYGAVGSWLYQVVAGIELDPGHPGYKHFFVQPRPGGGLTWARASHQSMYGEIMSSWEISDGKAFRLEAQVPTNTEATIRLPGAVQDSVMESGSRLEAAEGVQNARQEEGAVVVQVGSGDYEFTYPWNG